MPLAALRARLRLQDFSRSAEGGGGMRGTVLRGIEIRRHPGRFATREDLREPFSQDVRLPLGQNLTAERERPTLRLQRACLPRTCKNQEPVKCQGIALFLADR
jgi:hypothetical protein